MDLEMVLNELSLHPLATDVYEAHQRMNTLIQTMAVATKSGVKKTLRTNSSFLHEELAPGYPVIKWLNDIDVDRDTRRFLKTLVTKTPFLVDITESSTLDSFDLSDYFWQKKQAVGLGVAFLLDALALSLSSDPCWLENHLELQIHQLGDDGEIIDVSERVPHASIPDHVQTHLPWITKQKHTNMQTDIHDGQDICRRREDLFPHIYFGADYEAQLRQLTPGHIMLRSVITRLYELENYCSSWLDGPFDPYQIVSKVTSESIITLEMYRKEHTFQDHSGSLRIFSWHVRLTPNEWRLYFDPLSSERKVVVGYVGKHLPTKLYPS